MKWSVAFAFLGVVTLLAIFAQVDGESPASVPTQALVEVEINQLVLTRYDEAGKKLEQSSAQHAIRLEDNATTERLMERSENLDQRA